MEDIRDINRELRKVNEVLDKVFMYVIEEKDFIEEYISSHNYIEPHKLNQLYSNLGVLNVIYDILEGAHYD